MKINLTIKPSKSKRGAFVVCNNSKPIGQFFNSIESAYSYIRIATPILKAIHS